MQQQSPLVSVTLIFDIFDNYVLTSSFFLFFFKVFLLALRVKWCLRACHFIFLFFITILFFYLYAYFSDMYIFRHARIVFWLGIVDGKEKKEGGRGGGGGKVQKFAVGQ